MGVKSFFYWYSRRFSDCLSKQPQYPIDNLALDLNGLFHPVAQKVYQYGTYAPPTQFLTPSITRPKSMIQLFRAITDKIEYCRNVCRPRKRLILCVDGVAGLGKMNQQRQRRFRTAKSMENSTQTFNPNAFTPGTKLMDHLTKYIDWYLRMMITYHPEWKNLEIIFSNEKVPGEGEHKIMQYIKKYGNPTESYCIYGLDADLMMLGMVLPVNHVMIAREADENIVQFVDVALFRKEILHIMRWSSGSTADPSVSFNDRDGVHDFILLCFLVGNDFLPTIPTLSILDGGINLMMELYQQVGKQYGHLTRVNHRNKMIDFKMKALTEFFTELGKREKELMEKKYRNIPKFFPDPLVIQNMNENKELNLEQFKQDYYEKNLHQTDLPFVIRSYLDGMHWVLNYYVHSIPDWMWYYPYLYAPFLSDFSQVLNNYHCPRFELHSHVPPFLQLLVVLPSSSADLVPDELSRLMTSETSPLSCYYPSSFEVDMAGKKQEWEGIVLLPPISIDKFMESYKKEVRNIPPHVLKRNMMGKSFVYQYNTSVEKPFISFYGNIDKCSIEASPIPL